MPPTLRLGGAYVSAAYRHLGVTRFEHHRDPGRPGSLNRVARGGMQRVQARERLAHDPGGALSKRDQILTQPPDVLLYSQATDLSPSSAVTILELGARLLAPKEFGLDHQRGIAGPAADPNEIPVGRNGA